jgi:hypothetical protein
MMPTTYSRQGSWHQSFAANSLNFQADTMYRFKCPQEFQTPLGVRWNRGMTGKTMNNKQNLPSDIHIKRVETRVEGSCCSKDLVLYILDVK